MTSWYAAYCLARPLNITGKNAYHVMFAAGAVIVATAREGSSPKVTYGANLCD